MGSIRDRIADLKRKYPGTTVSWAPLKHGGGSFTVKEGGRLVAHIHLSEREMKETQNPRKRTAKVVKNLFGFGSKWTHESTLRTKREADEEAKEYRQLGITTRIRKVKDTGYGKFGVFTKPRSNPLHKTNPKRKRQTSIPKKVLEAHRRIWGGTIPPGALEALKREAARGGFRNPAAFPVVKKTTGWIEATAVKIVKRRGQPDTVLIRKPGSKKRR